MKASHLLSEKQMDEAIERMSVNIANEFNENSNLVLVGIKTRGVPLASWISQKIQKVGGRVIPVGSLDINLYRDDLSEVDEQPVVRKADLPFSVAGKGVILVDDVLYTGRTIRAALDALVDFGRPSFVRLAVLIDRGWRELPIQADYVGKTITTSAQQNVKVMFNETDGKNEVIIRE